MADFDPAAPARPKRGLLVPLLVGLVLAVLGGGAGYWTMTQGFLAPEVSGTEPEVAVIPPSRDDITFVPLETIIISLGPEESGRHLIFTAELEVEAGTETDVTRMSPRVLDVLNGYLRVVSLDELTDPTSLARLRAHMLRRVQVVTGPHLVHDLLVTQFVVN